jgi:hypothetical protein
MALSSAVEKRSEDAVTLRAANWRGGLVTAEDVRTVQLRPASPVVH